MIGDDLGNTRTHVKFCKCKAEWVLSQVCHQLTTLNGISLVSKNAKGRKSIPKGIGEFVQKFLAAKLRGRCFAAKFAICNTESPKPKPNNKKLNAKCQFEMVGVIKCHIGIQRPLEI